MHESSRRVAALVFVVSLAACKAKPGQPVPFEKVLTDASLHHQYVAVSGKLLISTGIMGGSSCKASRCQLELKGPDGTKQRISLSVATGSGEGEMAPLPNPYSTTDLKVKATGGKTVSYNEDVTVSGTLECHGNNGEDNLPCSMYVERID